MPVHPLFAQAAKQNEGYNGEYDDIDTSLESIRAAEITIDSANTADNTEDSSQE